MTEAYPPIIHLYNGTQEFGSRVRVTVEEYYTTPALIDNEVDVYLYDSEAEKLGLEAWRMLDGIDCNNAGHLPVPSSKYDLWFANGRCLADVTGDTPLYISMADVGHYTPKSMRSQ